MTHHHHSDGDAERAAHRNAERQRLHATMDDLAAALGIDAQAAPPARVAGLVYRFGPATYQAAELVGFDAECMRWIALQYRFWGEQLVAYAEAAEANLAAERAAGGEVDAAMVAELIADAERLLRDR